jgi:hypothetical protein
LGGLEAKIRETGKLSRSRTRGGIDAGLFVLQTGTVEIGRWHPERMMLCRHGHWHVLASSSRAAALGAAGAEVVEKYLDHWASRARQLARSCQYCSRFRIHGLEAKISGIGKSNRPLALGAMDRGLSMLQNE